MTNHAVSELVCLLKNGQLAKKYKVSSNYAKIKQSVLDILKREGFIKDYSVVEGKSYNTIDVILSYYNGEPVIKNIEIISKPGKRKYTGSFERFRSQDRKS
ncbi:MAG: hypothetical protein Ta2D_11710 [Rickettsiales bacterium]|nr:MAG: hypothetical protein Ta2D_11710 [Rickettsiales bacterium]